MSFEQSENSIEETINQEIEEKDDDNEYFDRIVGTSEYQFAESLWREQINENTEIKSIITNNENKPEVTAEKKENLEKKIESKETKKFSSQESEKYINDIFKEIESNIKDQPESVQKIIQEKKDKFKTFATINGNDFIFCDKNGSDILSLVKNKENPKKWKVRAFRASGSDHQWKALPGMREDNRHYMKGEENNPLHHYVQSAKLDKNLYQVISSLPETSQNNNAEEYIPTENKKFNNELEFKENYLNLKNKEWEIYQKGAQAFFDHFMFFNNKEKQLSLDAEWYKIYKKLGEKNNKFKQITDSIEHLYQNPLAKKDIDGWNAKFPGFKANLSSFLNGNYSKHYKEFIKKYQESVNDLYEWGFSYPIPQGLIPDFSKEKIIDSYQKGDINIEEYEVKSPEGDDLIFAMAHDEKGRVYIDNIYDPRVGMNDYGVPNQICQMGHLVYKPEDYNSQVFGIPEKYKKPSGNGYIDINALWENIPIIKNFKEELIKRGTLPVKNN